MLSNLLCYAQNPILVAAASDLAPLGPELTALYQKTYGAHLRLVPGSSGLLATQIRNGAPFDAYLSANLDFARDLEASGHLVKGSVIVYATGRLALFTKQTQFRSLDALTSKEVKHIAIANPVHAPYGAAARDLLRQRGLWDRLQPKLVYGENIRQALQIAESGNAEAALVAWSLVIGKGGVLLPASDHPPIRQAGGIVTASRRQAEARRLLDLLRSPAGQHLLRRFGFDPAETVRTPMQKKTSKRSAPPPATPITKQTQFARFPFVSFELWRKLPACVPAPAARAITPPAVSSSRCITL